MDIESNETVEQVKTRVRNLVELKLLDVDL